MIRFANVYKAYPNGALALKDVTFHVSKGEFVFLNLRLLNGFAGAAFAERFGIDVRRAFPHVDSFVRDGFLECVGDRWRLTARGLLFADSIFATFL